MNRTTSSASMRGITAGWIVLAIAIVVCLGVGVRFALLFTSQGELLVGDGQDPETYGFDLSTCLVDRAYLVGGGRAKDQIRALVDPPHYGPEEANQLKIGGRRNRLKPSDQVIGVVQQGEVRAYPIRLLWWHDAVNDTVGGVPILVTYHGLSGGAVVVDRRVNGQTLEFGVSGLLYNSNLVLYDRQPEAAQESLWCQLQQRAITGPAARDGLMLAPIPFVIMPWKEWLDGHPETRVMVPQGFRDERYKANPYGPYFGTDVLEAPVAPLPSTDRWPYKTPVMLVRAEGEEELFILPELADQVGEQGHLDRTIGGVLFRVHYRPDPHTAWVEPLGEEPPAGFEVRYALWFSYHALLTP